MNLCGKKVMYIGAFGGIGYAVCKKLLTKSLKSLYVLDLKVNDKMMKDFQQCAPDTCIKFEKFNLMDSRKKIHERVNQICCAMDKPDVIVNGGGVVKDSDPDATLQINLTGLVNTTLAAFPLMSKHNGGNGGLMVHIASILGLVYAPHICVYTGSKHGVIGFHRSISDQYYYDLSGIRHIAICPGYTTDTNIWTDFLAKDQRIKQATFDFSLPLIDKVKDFKTQKAGECANHFVSAMEKGENGGIYIIDLNKMKKVKIPEYLPI